MLTFLITAIAITGMSTVFFYNYVSEIVEKNYRESALSNLEQVYTIVENSMESMYTSTQTMLVSASFLEPLVRWLNNASDRNYSMALTKTAENLQELAGSSELIDYVYLYTPGGSFDGLLYRRNQDFDFEKSELMPIEKSGNRGFWYPAMENPIWDTGETVIPWVFGFNCGDRRNTLCYLVILIRQSNLQKLIAGIDNVYDGFGIYDSQGRTVLEYGDIDPLKDWLDSPEQIGAYDSRGGQNGYLMFHSYVESNDWHMLMCRSRRYVTGSIREIHITIIGANILIMLFGIFVMVLLVRRLTESLRELTYQMECMRNGDLTARLPYQHRDEIGQIAVRFNYMAERIEDLVDKQMVNIQELKEEKERVLEVQKQKREAELRALQAQIRPHFLYNTLNVITWEAASKGEKKISALSSSLGKFFRLTLSKGDEIIPLRDELAHVKSYLNIQQICYGKNLDYRIEAPKELENVLMIKLLLQPLVENSFYHGIKPMDRDGCIRVKVLKCGDDICFVVEDNGAGIPASRLQLMNESLEAGLISQGDGYGIYNVNERVRLYYGDGYGLTYESEPGTGTRAFLKIGCERAGEKDEL